MLKKFIKTYCPEIELVPVLFDKIRSNQTILPAIDLSNVFVADFVSLPERESFGQRFAGTRGKRVKEELKEHELDMKSIISASGQSLAKN